jgi:hypothetical protein
VVAVHRRYLQDPTVHAAIARTLETRIEVPTAIEPSAIAAIIRSRARAHLPSEPSADLAQVITNEAVTHLFDLYRTGRRGELRGVLRTAHVALTDACDVGADVITDRSSTQPSRRGSRRGAAHPPRSGHNPATTWAAQETSPSSATS